MKNVTMLNSSVFIIQDNEFIDIFNVVIEDCFLDELSENIIYGLQNEKNTIKTIRASNNTKSIENIPINDSFLIKI